jgi:gluconate transporter
MPANGPYLVAMTVAAIGLMLFLILALKLHAFLALMLSSMALGLAAHMAPAVVLKSIQFGFGDALGFVGVVVALGAMVGRFLEYSGGGIELADWLLDKFGRQRAVWAVLIAAFLVGLPIYFEVAFIIMVPLVWNLARESKRSVLLYGLPMAIALSVTHNLVPPHPGPVAAAQLLGADLGRIILYGILLSAPLAVLGGIVFGGWISKRMYVALPEMADVKAEEKSSGPPPRVLYVVLILALPMLLIFAGTVSGMANLPGKTALGFIGHPFAALFATVAAAMYFFGMRRGLNRDQVLKMATESLLPVGTLLAIIGGGGAFKQVIVDCGVGPYAGNMMAAAGISPIIVAYAIAAALRFATGAATVADITAAGIMAPIMKSMPGYSPEIIVLAICNGASLLSHVNDSGFWLVNNYFGMTVPQTLRSWTVARIVVSLTGLAIVLAAQALLGHRL